jgi:hypothetical protein
MDREALKKSVALFEDELADAEREASEAYKRVEALRQVVAGMRGLVGAEPQQGPALFTVESSPQKDADSPPAHANGTTLSARDAARLVLIETRLSWKVPDLAREIGKRALLSGDVSRPQDAVSTAIKRLVKAGEVERTGRGYYAYRLDKLPAAERAPLG